MLNRLSAENKIFKGVARMNRNILISIIILLLVNYMFASNFLNASAQENLHSRPIIDDIGVHINLLTPWHVYPNSTFNATLIIEATENIDYLKLNIVNITTFIDENETSLSLPDQNSLTIINFTKNSQEKYQFNITLPENSSKVVLGEINCEWKIKQRTFFNSAKFLIAAIVNIWREQFQNLQRAYKNLNDTCYQLNRTYHDLEDKYNTTIGELGVTQRLSVILGVTTAIFAVTTVYLFRRKPQVW